MQNTHLMVYVCMYLCATCYREAPKTPLVGHQFTLKNEEGSTDMKHQSNEWSTP